MHRNCGFWHARKVAAFLSELRQRLEVQQLKNSSADALSSPLRSEILLTIILVLARRSEKLTGIMRNFLFASIDFLDVVFALPSKLKHTLSRKLRATLGMLTLAPSFSDLRKREQLA